MEYERSGLQTPAAIRRKWGAGEDGRVPKEPNEPEATDVPTSEKEVTEVSE